MTAVLVDSQNLRKDCNTTLYFGSMYTNQNTYQKQLITSSCPVTPGRYLFCNRLLVWRVHPHFLWWPVRQLETGLQPLCPHSLQNNQSLLLSTIIPWPWFCFNVFDKELDDVCVRLEIWQTVIIIEDRMVKHWWIQGSELLKGGKHLVLPSRWFWLIAYCKQSCQIHKKWL